MSWKSVRDSLLRRLAPPLAWAYITFVGSTSRVLRRGDENLETLRAAGKNFALAFWHGRQAILVYTHRKEPCATLVSRSKDGEIIAETLRRFGQRTVRGSSSRGGAAALKELVEAGREGFIPAVTPDGPRGPERRVQSGVLFLARELGIPIVPLASGLRRKRVFRSWEDFHFPLPFNRVAVVHGRPLTVGPDDDLEAKAEELRQAIDAVTAEADALAES